MYQTFNISAYVTTYIQQDGNKSRKLTSDNNKQTFVRLMNIYISITHLFFMGDIEYNI